MNLLMRRARFWLVLLTLSGLLLPGCNSTPSLPSPPPTSKPSPSVTSTSIPSPTFTLQPPSTQVSSTPTQAATQEATPVPQKVRFAVIGDYGSGSEAEGDVANLIISWAPEFILTTGDNNYPDGELETIDEHIGQFFHEFIAPYQGSFGEGSQENRFFPTLGNHDWHSPGAEPYLDYFALAGNERYYDFVWGPVHFFALDSDSREPDGVGRSSQQAIWLQSRLSISTSPWKIVYFHHAPYSSGTHGPVDWMQWPFAEWGADLILSGHDHTYERILEDGITYIVNGLGGKSKYEFLGVIEGSQVRYNEDYGAMLVEADRDILYLEFINRQNEVIDSFQITKQ
jgi:tartrate-resistant acid phosphatase type 5